MATSSGNSSGSMRIQSSGSEEELQNIKDQRKRKRMESNRESARRSRQRKQKHLDDLTAQVTQLTQENEQILNNINVTSQHSANVEAENSVLKAQVMELSQRLHSLNEILICINSAGGGSGSAAAHGGIGNCMFEAEDFQHGDGFWNSQWNLMGLNHHPIVASAEIFDC